MNLEKDFQDIFETKQKAIERLSPHLKPMSQREEKCVLGDFHNFNVAEQVKYITLTCHLFDDKGPQSLGSAPAACQPYLRADKMQDRDLDTVESSCGVPR